MQQALDRNTLDRLVALGLKQGHLTTEDLRDSLPIESMSAEEIALIVVHLEESGVPVELEDSLLSPNPKPRAPEMKGAEIIPFPGRSARPQAKPSNAPLQPVTPPLPHAPEPEPHNSRFAHWAVAGSGLLVLLVLGLLIFAGAR
jgi:hypothetical protein